MPIHQQPTPHYLKDPLDLVIKNTVSKSDLTQSDLNKIMVAAQIQDRIARYRSRISGMTEHQLLTEEHSSARLARDLVERHGARPSKCHTHAIVAGRHKFAAPTRTLMASLRIGIDDPDNGCWLPENAAATPHPAFPKAPPQSRIHRAAYFRWLRIA